MLVQLAGAFDHGGFSVAVRTAMVGIENCGDVVSLQEGASEGGVAVACWSFGWRRAVA